VYSTHIIYNNYGNKINKVNNNIDMDFHLNYGKSKYLINETDVNLIIDNIIIKLKERFSDSIILLDPLKTYILIDCN
jgi:hypothetical protein